EVGSSGAAFRPWSSQSVGQPSAGKNVGAVRFFGDPGTAYQFRLTVRDAARNAAPAAVLDASVPASSGPPPTLADGAILGALPAQPDGAPPVLGVKQEHPSAHGALLLGSDASLHGLGADHGTPSVVPTSTSPAVHMVSRPLSRWPARRRRRPASSRMRPGTGKSSAACSCCPMRASLVHRSTR